MTINQFDDAAAAWDDDPRRQAVTRAIAGAIGKTITLNREMSMLEFGCGTASLSVQLADRVGSIHAVDTSRGMIDQVRHKLAAAPDLAAKISPVHCEEPVMDHLPGQWDLVCSAMVMHHIEDAYGVLEQLAARLRPGGWLAIADLYLEDGSFHGSEKVPHNGFDPEQLADALRSINLARKEITKVITFPKPGEDGQIRQYDLFLLACQLG